MLKLFLLRHAKSSRDDPSLQDIDRPLNARGQKAAKAMGRHMAKNGIRPGLVLCSPARRTRETWALVAAELPEALTLQVEDGLYDFGNGEKLMSLVKSRADRSGSILLVGHNPSLEELAKRLLKSGTGKALRDQTRLGEKFPTGALATLNINAGSWADLCEASATLESFVRPRDLE
jgi:phosphohistidine phosphatase